MNNLTRVFLVLLRLAIGWHFLVEGYEKYESVSKGPTTTNRPFTSTGFLRQSSGRFGPFFRKQVGDPDLDAIDRIRVVGLADDWRKWNLPEDLNRIKEERIGSGPNPKAPPPPESMPPPLHKAWKPTFNPFVYFLS